MKTYDLSKKYDAIGDLFFDLNNDISNAIDQICYEYEEKFKEQINVQYFDIDDLIWELKKDGLYTKEIEHFIDNYRFKKGGDNT